MKGEVSGRHDGGFHDSLLGTRLVMATVFSKHNAPSCWHPAWLMTVSQRCRGGSNWLWGMTSCC